MDFVTSDLHFDHAKIIEFGRPYFCTVEEMNQTLIDNWNAVVSETDTTYVLGDFCWKANKSVEFSYALNGRKVLILGNHDPRNMVKNPAKFGFDEVHSFGIDLKKVSLCHYPMKEARRKLMIHGHTHGTNQPIVFTQTPHAKRSYVRANVCVENWRYTPVRLERLIDMMTSVYEANTGEEL